jgi:hypothetical protein
MSSLTGVGIYIPNPLVDLPNWMSSLTGVGIYIPSKSLRSCVGELGGLRVTIYHTTIVWYLGMGRVNTTQKTRCLTKMADRFCGCCCQWHWHSIDSPPRKVDIVPNLLFSYLSYNHKCIYRWRNHWFIWFISESLLDNYRLFILESLQFVLLPSCSIRKFYIDNLAKITLSDIISIIIKTH